MKELTDSELMRRVEFVASVGEDGAPIDSRGAQKAQTSALLLQVRYAERQARAAESAAEATKRYTRWMALSVFGILLSAFATLLIAIQSCAS